MLINPSPLRELITRDGESGTVTASFKIIRRNMLSYKDKTFCASKKHMKDCDRQITSEEKNEADKLNLPVAWAYFCGKP